MYHSVDYNLGIFGYKLVRCGPSSETKQGVCTCFENSIPLTLRRLGFLKVVFFQGGQLEPHFLFQEGLTQYHYNFIQLLNNLFNVD